ncbi:MAG: glucose-6-phosphate isomerase [Bacteroidetes bacterium]|nr:MAG: glucose-6-phosphate isomerase [Bacteroidota bacterium]
MSNLTLDLSPASAFIQPEELSALKPQILAAAQTLEDRSGPGNSFLGWLDLPGQQDQQELDQVRKAARRIQEQSSVLVVVGIGGSYLGSKAALEFCHPGSPLTGGPDQNALQVCFAGTNLSAAYLNQLLQALEGKDFSVNVISKSGTTTEPAIAFRILKKKLEERYGKDGARSRIYATTDRSRGALKTLSDQEGYETFVVPDDVGGRFSVLTPVGLLPVSAAGIDIGQLMAGAANARQQYQSEAYEDNAVLRYVAARNILHRKGKDIELLISYEPRLLYLTEWWKQLYGESEGKDGKGIFPASASFTTDLHSLGQYIQDGKRHLFETLLEIEKPESDLIIEAEPEDLDGLNYLAGKSLDFVNKKAAEGTILAHIDGGVPNLKISIPEATPYHLGQLFYFFEKACAISGYLLGVNPFDQPGVEAYKKNMFRLLGKK